MNLKQLIMVHVNEKQKLLGLNCQATMDGILEIPLITGKETIPIGDILYCKADSNYCLIYCHSKPKNMVSKTLKWVGSKLPKDTFIRIHQSYLVNKKAITKFRFSPNPCLTLSNGAIFPIARSRKKYVRETLLSNPITILN